MHDLREALRPDLEAEHLEPRRLLRRREMRPAAETHGLLHQGEVVHHEGLLGEHELDDDRLDGQDRSDAAVVGIVVKPSPVRLAEAFDPRRLEFCPLVQQEHRHLLVERREQHVDVHAGQLADRQEIRAAGQIGRPLVEREGEGDLFLDGSTFVADLDPHLFVDLLEPVTFRQPCQQFDLVEREILRSLQEICPGIIDDEQRGAVHGVGAGPGATRQRRDDVAAAALGQIAFLKRKVAEREAVDAGGGKGQGGFLRRRERKRGSLAPVGERPSGERRAQAEPAGAPVDAVHRPVDIAGHPAGRMCGRACRGLGCFRPRAPSGPPMNVQERWNGSPNSRPRTGLRRWRCEGLS